MARQATYPLVRMVSNRKAVKSATIIAATVPPTTSPPMTTARAAGDCGRKISVLISLRTGRTEGHCSAARSASPADGSAPDRG